MAYGVIRTDNMQATKNGNIKTGRYYVGATATACENGNVVLLDSILSASTNREVYKCVYPSAITNTRVYLIATPEIIYSEETKATGALSNFRNAAGANITLLGLAKGDLFSISDDCIVPINDADDLPAVGNYVILTASSTKWTEAASLGGTEKVYGKIIAREIYNGTTYLNVVEMLSVD